MKAFVLDASVAIKWVLPPDGEPLATEAGQLLESLAAGEITFSVPDLFWSEVTNILWKAVRRHRISERSAYDALETLTALELPTAATAPLIKEALRIALVFQRSAYDSMYLALAVESGRPLITADERLANAVGSELPIQWLGSRT